MIGTGLMMVGCLGMVGLFSFANAKAKVSTYTIYNTVVGVIFSAGGLLSVFERDDNTIIGFIIMLLILIAVWYIQVKGVAAYRDMKKAREELDELLK